MRRMRCAGIALIGLGLLAAVAHAGTAATPLDRFLDGLKTLRASFTQTVMDARGHTVSRATGTLVISRPGKFRWETHPAGTAGSAPGGSSGAPSGQPSGAPSGAADDSGQLLVDDGHNLWFYDRELQQVTVKPAGAGLSATPAMLLSGSVDVHKTFSISDAGRDAGMDWVLVQPRASSADFRRALLGFADGVLRRMIVKDKLGQTATLDFQHVERNAPVSAAAVSFTPPASADVIGTPAK